MYLKCLNCSHEFEGTISYDEQGWHSSCPECDSSFDVDVPEGSIIMAFADAEDEENPYANFTENIHDACLVSYYAFASRKEFLGKWEEKIYNQEPDGMWYWVVEGDNCITYGGPDIGDIELICEAWGIEPDSSGDVAILLDQAYASCHEGFPDSGTEKGGDANIKICYNCVRKTECYSASQIKNLKKGETYKDKTGYDCGVAYTNYKELRKFVEVIGEAIATQNKKTQEDIFQFIAERYNLPLYNVRLEFEKRQSVTDKAGVKYITLCTVPDDDSYYCKWFVVETEWLKGWIQEEHDGELSEADLQEALINFLENYAWDETWWTYQNAKSWNAIISEGHDE